jgi:serine/threonine protein kinase
MSPSEASTARARDGQGGRTRRSAAPPPLVLERYRLHRRLGAGAFGTVWMARDERLERDVAVKILPRERIVGGRFEREARAAARLAHPGIVTLYEAAVDDDGAYLVSELVRGTTLDDLLDQGRLSDRDIVAVGIALCDALAHAHAQGVVHRDVKPSNILVPAQPVTPAQLAKLTDFGVARVIGGDSLTRTGDVVGTLAYMAPEQAEGLEAGAGADVYSLALVLYEALTGINPVSISTAAQRARRLGAHLPPLRRQRRDLPRQLGSGIDLALRPRPRERGTIGELRASLVAGQPEVGDEPGVVGEPLSLERTARLTRLAPKLAEREPDPPAGAEAASERAPSERASSGRQPASEEIWVGRGLAALAAAATAGWLAIVPLSPSPAPAFALAALAGGLTLLLPRIGWLAIGVAACALAVAQDHPGIALLIAAAVLVPVLAMIRRPTAWPLAAGAPALGLLGLAGAWPALAGRAGTIWQRAALGFSGWIWLVLAAPLANRILYLPQIPGAHPLSAWAASPYDTIHHALTPIVTSGVLAPAPIWALAAAILPWLVRCRSLALDTIRAVVWSATLVSATGVAVAAAHGSAGLRAAPTATAGAVVGAAVALTPSAFAAWRARGGLEGGSEAGFS